MQTAERQRRRLLYIACGISGAPTFDAADYAVIGNIFEVVPALTDEIQKLKG